MTDPIIVTAALPDAIFSYADGLRRAHFPPERNVLSAHLTLFHAIPPSCESELFGLLADIAATTPPIGAELVEIMSLGRGTALRLQSGELGIIRAGIADHFHGSLTAQDQARPRFHITIQNKVSPAEAKALQGALAPTFRPRSFAIPALEAHYYRGGPWERAGRWALRGKPGKKPF
ncbi:2'-5' RNA ligase family protein [Croceicoccus mobilis]|uniref:2'-5' RNA ligase family protein n=1 Tax=Croceicoccus mobilis TaxID=1703339 RepID=A0A916Z2A4_9SPHN|nr:2'-5' RNA ligase family protein [Croceicoccus mobilis]GGD72808.1 hypothetical protein GCM10010990_23030 [Croceicoccus mobilis]